MNWLGRFSVNHALAAGGIAIALLLGLNISERMILGGPPGSMDLQFVYSALQLQAMLGHWTAGEIFYLKVALLVDIPLIVSYAFAICVWLFHLGQQRPRSLWLVLPLAAALPDLTENFLQWQFLGRHLVSDGWTMTATLLSLSKWLALWICLGCLLYGWVQTRRRNVA